jgi:hypothetical protein
MSTTPAGTQPAAPADPPQANPAGDPPTTPPPTTPAPPEPQPSPAPPPPPPAAATGDEPLGEAGKAALDREREARKVAEREAAAQKKRADDLEGEKLTDQQKLEKRAEDGDKRLGEGTEKLRRANLITALADKGLVGGKARAAARLLTVEYDDGDEPKELDKAIEAAKAEYGEELFAGATPAGSGDQPGGDQPNGDQPQTPDLHQGARAPQTEQEEAAAIQALTGAQAATPGSNPISILEN